MTTNAARSKRYPSGTDRRRRPRAALLLALTVLAGTLQAGADDLIIVAAGDSYASGEGAPDKLAQWPDPGRWWGEGSDLRATACHRSSYAAAEEAARRLGASWPVQFHSVACSGGETGVSFGETGGFYVRTVDDPYRLLLGDRGQFAEIKRRMGTVRPIDALVISIGGNDIGFGKTVEECITSASCVERRGQVTAALLNQLPDRLRHVIAAVNEGQAGTVRHAFLVQYPDPTTFPVFQRCAQTLTSSGTMYITREEADWASQSVVAPLNAKLSEAVIEANDMGSDVKWHLVTGVVEEFQDHGYCAGSERFINTLGDSVDAQGFGDFSGTMHPNHRGQSALANAVTNAMWFLAAPQAEFVSQSVPTTMMAGQTHRVSITMRNTGAITWMATDNVRLGSQAWENNNVWGRSRVELPGNVAPGESATFTFDVTAPAYQAKYKFQWRLLREFVQWFGAFTPLVEVSVQSANRQMSPPQVVENWVTSTSANVTVYARDAGTGSPVDGSILRDGAVVGRTGQPFTYQRIKVKVCEPNQKGYLFCHYEAVEQEFAVTATGYDAGSFTRY
jgi:hypothetical protein